MMNGGFNDAKEIKDKIQDELENYIPSEKAQKTPPSLGTTAQSPFYQFSTN